MESKVSSSLTLKCWNKNNTHLFSEVFEDAFLDRIALRAQRSITILQAESCLASQTCPCFFGRSCIHIQTKFVSWVNFFGHSTTARLVYLLHRGLAYHIKDPVGLSRLIQISQTSLHPLVSEPDFRLDLNRFFPSLVLESVPLLRQIRDNISPTSSAVALTFYAAKRFIRRSDLESFNGLLRVGYWGSGTCTNQQGILVFAGTETPAFFLCPIGYLNPIKYKTQIKLFQHLTPVDLHQNRASRIGKDPVSTQICPCESSSAPLYRSLHPKKVSKPVGIVEASSDTAHLLQLLGLYGEKERKLMDLCSWLSIISFDVERWV